MRQSGCLRRSSQSSPDPLKPSIAGPLAYLDRGRAGDAELAVADLTRAMTIRPERAATHLNLAVAYKERGSSVDVDRAIASLNEALSIQPDYASAYVNRAGTYVARRATGDLDLAFDDLEKALEIEPELASRASQSRDRLSCPWFHRRFAVGHRGVQPCHRSFHPTRQWRTLTAASSTRNWGT